MGVWRGEGLGGGGKMEDYLCVNERPVVQVDCNLEEREHGSVVLYMSRLYLI